ncbi:MAG: sugar ABC transporter permease YjfF [Treponemataceae bacterium]|nr:sugar ABC transporter permease YjfF [Treponemataceae bacterium]
MENKLTKHKKHIDSSNFLLIITIALFAVMYGVGLIFEGGMGFAKPQVFFNMLIDNAGLLIAATGMTIVMIIGGIDISVGSMVCLVCMILSFGMEKMNMPAGVGIAIVLVFGIIFGAFQGWCIAYMDLQPFIVTLAGLFFCRGAAAMISSNQIAITKNKWFLDLTKKDIIVPFMDTVNKRGVVMHTIVHPSVIIALITVLIIWYVLKYTRFGRNLFAIGGSEQSALLMGINVRRTKFYAYVLEGFLSALAGFVWCLNTSAGFVDQARGFEMEAISSAVIGGTMLTGGVGTVVGTVFGVLIKATIETLIKTPGKLSSWWTSIFLSLILCIFIVLQSLITIIKDKRTK